MQCRKLGKGGLSVLQAQFCGDAKILGQALQHIALLERLNGRKLFGSGVYGSCYIGSHTVGGTIFVVANFLFDLEIDQLEDQGISAKLGKEFLKIGAFFIVKDNSSAPLGTACGDTAKGEKIIQLFRASRL